MTNKVNGESKISGKQPLLLGHSMALRYLRADEIVALYARRVQIEENFRDSKSMGFGFRQEFSRSRLIGRIRALLVISNLTSFFLRHIGQIAEAEGLQRRHKATTRKTREISVISLARILVKLLKIPISRFGLNAMRERLQC
jgi:hypothetical protein